MQLTLTRRDFTPDGIFSELTDDRGKISFVTLEHSYDGKPKLYDGTFKCVKGTHELHDCIPFQTFEITGVTGHTGILFHVGNFNKDSDGCVLVGMDRDDKMIRHSIIAFSKLTGFLENVQEFTLVVTSPA